MATLAYNNETANRMLVDLRNQLAATQEARDTFQAMTVDYQGRANRLRKALLATGLPPALVELLESGL